jgi:hypothetical protein
MKRTISMMPAVKSFFDPSTWTVSHVVYDKPGSACAVIDAVLDYDPKSGRTSTASADTLMAFVQENQLKVAWILETHAHADHLSAAHYLRDQLWAEKLQLVQPSPMSSRCSSACFTLSRNFQPMDASLIACFTMEKRLPLAHSLPRRCLFPDIHRPVWPIASAMPCS